MSVPKYWFIIREGNKTVRVMGLNSAKRYLGRTFLNPVYGEVFRVFEMVDGRKVYTWIATEEAAKRHGFAESIKEFEDKGGTWQLSSN